MPLGTLLNYRTLQDLRVEHGNADSTRLWRSGWRCRSRRKLSSISRSEDLLHRYRSLSGYISERGEVWLRHSEALRMLDECEDERIVVLGFDLAR